MPCVHRGGRLYDCGADEELLIGALLELLAGTAPPLTEDGEGAQGAPVAGGCCVLPHMHGEHPPGAQDGYGG
jgi:hypothetical protein